MAWKTVEHELALLEAHGAELGISVRDTDRALGGGGGSCLSPPASRSSSHAAATSTGAAIAAALVNTPILGTPSRKWNVDTAAIRNEPKPPKQITGVAASPPRPSVTGPRTEPETPGFTQMTQMTQMTPSAAASPAPRIASRRRNLFSPAAQGLAAASAPGGESESLSVMPTQELEGYLERIQMQNRALSQWEQSRKRDANHQPQLGSSQALKQRGKAAHKTASSAMERLMTSWMASGSSQANTKPAARSLAAAISCEDGNEDEEEDDSQTQMLPPESYTDSPDLLSNGGGAFSRLDALSRTRAAGGGHRTSTAGLEEVSSKAVNGHAAAPSSARPSSTPSASWRSSGARTAASGGAQPKSAKARRSSAVDKSDDEDEVEDSQLPHSVALQQHNERRKKQRVSLDFAGAIAAFNASRTQQPQPERTVPGGSVLPVARIDSAHNGKPIVSGSVVRRNSRAAPPSNLLTLATRSRPPLPSAARQIVDDIRKASGFTLIATDLTAAECKRVSTACALLGGRFGLSFDLRRDPETGVLCSSVTHLIAKPVPNANGRRCKRTAKYMRALAEGSLVMDYAWVEASLAAGRWLSEEGFEMIGDAYSSSVGKPRESHERRLATGRRHDLFQLFRFVLLCDEQEFDYQIGTLSGVVENFGGAVISSAQFLRTSPGRRAGKTHVGLVGRATAPDDAKTKWQQNQIPIVRVAWLFECISHLEIVPYEDFYPYF